MEFTPSYRGSLQADIQPSFRDTIMHEKDLKYGLPRFKKYPMPDVSHVKSAIKFFNYVTPANEKELARAILARMDEYGMSSDSINVGDNNRFKKYLDQAELKHFGIKGMHWGVRRYENYDGTLTAEGKARYKQQGLDLEKTTSRRSRLIDGTDSLGLIDVSPRTQAAAKKLGKEAKKLIDEEGERYDDACEHFKELKKNFDFREDANKTMRAYFNNPKKVDDDEYVRTTAQEVAFDLASEKWNLSEAGKRVNNYDDRRFDWNNKVNDYTNQIIKEVGDQPVQGIGKYSKKTTTYKNIVKRTLESSGNIRGRNVYEYDTFRDASNSYELDELANTIYEDFMKERFS